MTSIIPLLISTLWLLSSADPSLGPVTCHGQWKNSKYDANKRLEMCSCISVCPLAVENSSNATGKAGAGYLEGEGQLEIDPSQPPVQLRPHC